MHEAGDNTMRVLVAEDEEILAELVATGLRRAGFAVDTVYSRDAALACLGLHDYDVVVLDRDLPRFFQPFRRGEGRDRMGQGSVRGLSIVRSIAWAHGGAVTAVPGPEGGLAVTVRLPVDQSSATTPRALAQAGSPARTSR